MSVAITFSGFALQDSIAKQPVRICRPLCIRHLKFHYYGIACCEWVWAWLYIGCRNVCIRKAGDQRLMCWSSMKVWRYCIVLYKRILSECCSSLIIGDLLNGKWRKRILCEVVCELLESEEYYMHLSIMMYYRCDYVNGNLNLTPLGMNSAI